MDILSNDYVSVIASIFGFAIIAYLIVTLFISKKEGLENQTIEEEEQVSPVETATSIETADKGLRNILAIKANKTPYEDIIVGLTNYYDNLIVNTIINAKMNANGEYNLENIIKYKQIQDVLTHSLNFIDSE